MAKTCPVSGTVVLYADCIECDVSERRACASAHERREEQALPKGAAEALPPPTGSARPYSAD